METILKQPRQKIEEQTQGKVIVVMEHKQKAAWIGKKGGGSEQRWRITDGQDREWVEESQRDWKCSLKHVETVLDQ